MTDTCTIPGYCYCGEPLSSQHRPCPSPEEIWDTARALRMGELIITNRCGVPVKHQGPSGGQMASSDEEEREYRRGLTQEESDDD